MKLLQNGRKTLVWLGVHFADDDPISSKQKLAKKAFAVTFAITFIVVFSFYVISFLNVQLNDVEEFFFTLLEFLISIQCGAAFITIYLHGSRISTVFQGLTQIYEKCKQTVLSDKLL